MEDNSIEIKQVTEEAGDDVSTGTKIGIIAGVIVLLALFIGGIIFLLNYEKTPVIRDIFVILLGLELFVIGFATVLLILQTTRLINMFQHEIKPVLEKANETMSTLRGTAIFMSDTLAEPVIKFNSYLASVRQALQLLKNLSK